jgi:hypothetical protein
MIVKGERERERESEREIEREGWEDGGDRERVSEIREMRRVLVKLAMKLGYNRRKRRNCVHYQEMLSDTTSQIKIGGNKGITL